MTEDEIKAAKDEQTEKDNIKKALKAGGGATAILGGLGYGVTKGALALDKARNANFENVPEKFKLRKLVEKLGHTKEPLNPNTISILDNGKKISAGLAIVGGTAYGGTKAYEHYKNRKNKNKEEE